MTRQRHRRPSDPGVDGRGQSDAIPKGWQKGPRPVLPAALFGDDPAGLRGDGSAAVDGDGSRL